jgi:hypothetical protein
MAIVMVMIPMTMAMAWRGASTAEAADEAAAGTSVLLLQTLTKNALELQPALHRQDNSLLQPELADGHDSHYEHPVLPIDRGTEHLPQILRMMSLMMVDCSPPPLERLHACVSPPSPEVQSVVVCV